jgi:hypothetical protein
VCDGIEKLLLCGVRGAEARKQQRDDVEELQVDKYYCVIVIIKPNIGCYKN